MRAAMTMGTAIPKLCATDSLNSFGSCRLCLVEIDGRGGTPASCTTPVASRHGGADTDATVGADPPRRDGAVYLRPSAGLPDLWCERRLRAAGHGRRGRAARGPLCGYDGVTTTPTRAKDESNPYFSFDPSKCIVCNRCVRACEEVQGTFALTIQARGFSSKVSPGAGGDIPRQRMRLLRGLRPGLPDRDADREIRPRFGPAGAFRGHHLRLLRGRLLVQGGDARRAGRAHGPVEGRKGQSRA